MTPMAGKGQSTILALFGRRISGQYPAAPCSPGPFFLLLNNGRKITDEEVRARQRSGEGDVRKNGRPKGCIRRVRFFSVPLRFALETPENLKGQRTNGLSKNTLFGRPFSARRLLRSFGAPPRKKFVIWKYPLVRESDLGVQFCSFSHFFGDLRPGGFPDPLRGKTTRNPHTESSLGKYFSRNSPYTYTR